MQTKSIIHNSAVVTRLIQVSEGDLYKRLVESTYSSPKIKVGIVTDLYNNGEKAAIGAIEFEADYSSITTSLVILTEKEVDGLMPIKLEDVEGLIADFEKLSSKKVSEAEEALMVAQKMKERVAQIKATATGVGVSVTGIEAAEDLAVIAEIED